VDHLPDSKERLWLEKELKLLVEQRGHAPLVLSPVLTASKRWFPEDVAPDEFSLRVLALRLLGYAGLDLDAEVHGYDAAEAEVEYDARGARTARHEGAAAWYAGTKDGVCIFGCSDHAGGDPAALVGTMAHEVAHAYRDHHGLMVEDRDTEELLTDLTTVFLGFGVLTTNASYLYRTSGSFDGSFVTTEWSHAQRGYLGPKAFAYALALALEARGEAAELKTATKHLETTQRAFFKAALKDVRKNSALLETLGVPDPATWPPGPDLDELTAPFEIEEVLVDDPPEPEPDRTWNEGTYVYRVRRGHGWLWAAAAFVPSFVVFLGIAKAAASPMVGIFFLIPVFVAFRMGHAHASWLCSDPDCTGAPSPERAVCPGCGAEVRDEAARLR